MGKKEKKPDKNLSLLIVAILLLSIFVISIEVFSINNNNRKKEEMRQSAYEDKTSPTKKGTFYDTSNLSFIQVDLKDNPYNLTNTCLKGCNLKIDNSNVIFIIKLNNDTNEYRLDIVNDKTPILENKYVGVSLEGAQLSNYTDSGYKMLKMKIKKEDFLYDYAIFIDELDNKYDEISSLNANEMELLENGVIYYYDICGSPSKKVKAVRAPFSTTPAIISSEISTFSWCN